MSEPMNGIRLIVALREGVRLSRRCGKPTSIIRYMDGELRAVENPVEGDEIIVSGIDAPPATVMTKDHLDALSELASAASRIKRAVTLIAPSGGLTVSDMMGEMLLRGEVLDTLLENEDLLLSKRAERKVSMWKSVLSIFS